MLLSVIINTYNRCESLRTTLESLSNQSCSDFEVVVVNGPSTDDTEKVVMDFPNVKLVSCPERNLSISRNLGIDYSAGDIVAFIDDDAIAEYNWVRDILLAYTDDKVGGVGGLVYDYTGVHLQYKYSSCDRLGDTDFYIMPPFDRYNTPNCEKFLYLQGTNCSFRRSCLEEIGGFDEEFEYYLDEVDVCMRIIDKGYSIKPLDNAFVYHKYRKSFLRTEDRVVLHPYAIVKNKHYFAYKNNSKLSDSIIKERLSTWLKEVRDGGNYNYSVGKMTEKQLSVYMAEVDAGIKYGTERGKGKRKNRPIASNKHDFKRYMSTEFKYERLTVCYVSKEYPPINFGGIGRYTYDLATTFARYGHNVHVITEGVDHDTVDYENGVWVHRIVPKLFKPLKRLQLGWNLSLMYSNYLELKKIDLQCPIDIVNGPIWLCETGVANLLLKRPVVVTLMTTQKIIKNIMGFNPEDSYEYDNLIRLEHETLKRHKYVHAISSSIASSCQNSIAVPEDVNIISLGCRDVSNRYVKTCDSSKVRILSVGRLEERKGTDLLLSVIPSIVKKYDNVEFIFIGKDTDSTKTKSSFKKQFLTKYAKDKDILRHVVFKGDVNEDELMQAYADADICCTPSRYESFGIVLLEAMSFNNAIIATKIGGMRDIITNENTGLFFSRNNIEELEKCLVDLIDNKTKREQLAYNARKEYEAKYTLDKVYNKLYTLYCNVIKDYKQFGDTFTVEDFYMLVRNSENISEDEAKDIVDCLLNDEMAYLASNNSYEYKLKEIYNKVKSKCPKLAVKLKKVLYPFYMKFKP